MDDLSLLTQSVAQGFAALVSVTPQCTVTQVTPSASVVTIPAHSTSRKKQKSLDRMTYVIIGSGSMAQALSIHDRRLAAFFTK